MKKQHTVLMLVLCALALGSACNRTPEGRRDAFMAKARGLVEKKEYSRALIEFRNATQAMPKDPEPLYEMSLAAEKAGDLRTAVQALRKALDADPKHRKSQVRMAQFMASTTDAELLEEARGKLQELAGQQGEDDASVLASLALTQVRLGDFDAATANLERLLGKTPSELAAWVLLARTKLGQSGPKAAEATLQEACAKLPQSAMARVILAEFYLGQKRTGDAKAELGKALAIDPQQGRAQLLLARLLATSGQKDQAAAIYKELSKREGAETIYGRFLLRERRTEDAIAEFERLQRDKPDDRTIRTVLVTVYNSVGRHADGLRLLEAALSKNAKDGEALMQRAELRLAQRKFSEAEGDLNIVRKLRPNDAGVRYVLARLNRDRGNLLTYRQELTEALRLNPMLVPVRAELAESLTKSGQAKTALETLASAPPDQVNTLPLLLQRVAAHSALGNSKEMRADLDAGLKQFPGSAELTMWDASFKLRSGNTTAGRAALEQSLKNNPADLNAVYMLVQSHLATKDIPGAVAKAQAFVNSQPKSAEAQSMLGQVLLVKGDLAGSRKAFEAAAQLNPTAPAPGLSLVQLDIREKQLDSASKRLADILAREPNHPDARLWVSNLQIMKGDHASALTNLRRILETNPKHPDALNNLAYILAEEDKLDESLKYAQQAVELAPENGDYGDTLGWILYKKGVYPSAIQHLERAAVKSSDAAVRYHLSMAYAKAGESEKSKEALRAALRKDANHPLASQAQALAR